MVGSVESENFKRNAARVSTRLPAKSRSLSLLNI